MRTSLHGSSPVVGFARVCSGSFGRILEVGPLCVADASISCSDHGDLIGIWIELRVVGHRSIQRSGIARCITVVRTNSAGIVLIARHAE